MKWKSTFVELDKKTHDRNSFNCGEKQLNLFIKKQTAKHMKIGISKTMILPSRAQIGGKDQICAFYTFAPSSIKRESLPAELAKKLPRYPAPVFLLAQLAVHLDCQGQRLGEIALVKALEYLWKISFKMPAFAIIVDCLNSQVKEFYKKYGFETLCDCNGKSRMYIPMPPVKTLFK